MSDTGDAAARTRYGLPSGSIVLLTMAAALLCAVGLRQFASILGPLLLALVLSIAVSPVRRVLTARGAPGWLATGATIVVVYAVVAGFAWAGLALGAHFASVIATSGDDIERVLQDWVGSLSALGVDPARLDAWAAAIDLGGLSDAILALLGGLSAILGSLFFVIVLLFFTVTDAGSFIDNLARISGRGQRMADAFHSFAEGTRSYMFVATTFGAVVALIDVGVLWALGVPDPWLWGLLAFLTNYIPNVGFVIGVIPPAFIALVDQGVGTALAVVGAYAVVNFLLQMIVQPRVVGRTVGLSGSLTFLSLLWWTAIFGGIGALIAVPLTILVKAILVDHDPERRWLRPLLESGAEPPAPAAAERGGQDVPEPASPTG